MHLQGFKDESVKTLTRMKEDYSELKTLKRVVLESIYLREPMPHFKPNHLDPNSRLRAMSLFLGIDKRLQHVSR